MTKIRVFVADDHAVLRCGLRLLIDAEADMEVTGEAGTFGETLARLPEVQPDVVTLDLTMPGSPGLAAINAVREVAATPRLIVLTMHDDPAYVRSALAMGAAGYVAKSAADTALISAIRSVCRGRVFVDVQSDMGTQPVAAPLLSAAAPADCLSRREREVLGLIAEGHTNRAVADQLDLSVKTIESYRARLMEKLGLTGRADLTRFAIEQGLLGRGPGDQPV